MKNFAYRFIGIASLREIKQNRIKWFLAKPRSRKKRLHTDSSVFRLCDKRLYLITIEAT